MRTHSYSSYSAACFLVWAVALSVVAVVFPEKAPTVRLVFFGWTIGWLSATIARQVYPPPPRR